MQGDIRLGTLGLRPEVAADVRIYPLFTKLSQSLFRT